MKIIYFTVTTDLSYDQRMIRICTTLAQAGYQVTLVGRLKKSSIPLIGQPYDQKRIFTFFEQGMFFYIEYNIRLFFFLLTRKMNACSSIDLDTILPVWLVTSLRKKLRIYDAHELFCEMKEVVSRQAIYRTWKNVEKLCVPHFRNGYTVNQSIADEFRQMYGVNYQVVRNVPFLKEIQFPVSKENFIIYQGSVNEGRSFDTLIPAMQWVNIPLLICGDGNFMQQVKLLIAKYGLQQKVILKGLIEPHELRYLTQKARIGITLFENNGKSNYLSLANRFFDYIHAGTPQLCVDYPAYQQINNTLQIAVVTKDLSAENIAKQLNTLLQDEPLYSRLLTNCLELRQKINWEIEQNIVIEFYRKLFETVE